MRSAQRPVMAIGHLVMAALYLPWLALHVLVLLALGQVDVMHAGGPVIGLSLTLHGAAWLTLVGGGVALLKGARSGRSWSLAYAVLAAGAAILLWLTGARPWFALLLLTYPFMVAYVFLRAEAPS